MRLAWLVAVAVGCTPVTPRESVVPAAGARAPRLPPPPVLDHGAPDAAYRTAVAVQLQRPWGQFLEDCRIRLSATDPLNQMALATTADLTIDAGGKVVDVALAGSGNADFDRAVRQVIVDAAPLPPPPVELRSDDDRLHLRWLFARDRRQAGPVTSSVVEVVLPIAEVTANLLEAGDLARAARRIKREPAGTARDEAITKLMTAGVREALASNDGTVQRAAIEAIRDGKLGTLAIPLLDLIRSTSDGELRRAALHTAAVLGDHAVVGELVAQLDRDFGDRKLALADAQSLIALDASAQVTEHAADQLLARGGPNPVAFHVLGLLEIRGLDNPKDVVGMLFKRWRRSPDARVRAGLCAAHTRAPTTYAVAALSSGLADRDAKVRAACLHTITERMAYAEEKPADAFVGSKNIDRVIALVRDRDVLVRAAAIRALAAVLAEPPHGEVPARRKKARVLDPAAFPDLSADPAAEVRVAYLQAIAALSQLRPMTGGRDRVSALTNDRDAEVRAAAWETWRMLLLRPVDKIEAAPPPAELAAWTVRASTDPEPEVRRAVIDVITDEVLLLRMSSTDDDAAVRTGALVRAVERGGRAGSADFLIDRFASAWPASAERVRAALAWHLGH